MVNNITNSSTSDLTMPSLQPLVGNNSTQVNYPYKSSIPLPKFSGNPQELDLFISMLNDRAQIEKWPDSELLNAVRFSLEGEARQFFLQCNEIKPITNSTELFNKLKEFFKPEGSAIHKQKYDSLSILPGETIRNLQHRIDFLTKKVFPEISDTTALNSLKFNKLMQALPPNLKQHIAFNITQKNYEEAVKAATIAQDFFIETQDSSTTSEISSNCQLNALQEKIETQNSEILKLSEKLKTPISKPSNQNRPYQHHSSKFKSRDKFSRKDSHSTQHKGNNNRGNHKSFNQWKSTYQPKFQRNFQGRRPYFDNFSHQSGHYSQAAIQNDVQPSCSRSNNKQLTCQICLSEGHSARDCSSARMWLNLKETVTPANYIPPKLISEALGADATCPPSSKSATSTSIYPEFPEITESPQLIANVNISSPSIPIINVNFANLTIPVLVDTGSSISIISSNFFNQNKANFKYRHLSRTVKISTINSEVKFMGCIDCSFKIKAAHYRHPMFICDFGEDSLFKALLGFDFITKFNIVIVPDIECCKVNNEYIPFINRKSKFNPASSLFVQNEIVQHTKLNEPKHIDFSKLVDVPPFIPAKSSIPDVTKTEIKASIAHKFIIHPESSSYVKLKCCFSDKSFINNDLVFVASQKNSNLNTHDAIISFSDLTRTIPELTQLQDHTSEEITILPSKSKCITETHTFYVLVENVSSETISINKNTNFGTLFKVDDIKLQSGETYDHNSTIEQFINFIKASPRILNKRHAEFSKDKIKMCHLPLQQQDKLHSILSKNFAAFSASMDTLGHSDRVVPEIKFSSDNAIKALPFPIPQALQQEAKQQIDQMVEAGIIEKNIASWACPILLVKKKGDATGRQTYRLALDLRLLNSVIEHSSYPIPRIQSIITNMAKYKYFTLLDMPSAYWQMHLPEKYQDRLSFTSPWGTHKYKRLPFGLKNASSYFQALADSIIEEVNMPGIEAYQDDFVICSNSFEETIQKLNKFLNVFQKANLTLNIAKCSFHKTEVDFLGFHLQDNKIFPLTANIQKINSFPTPKTKKHIKRFLGLAGFYRTLIPSFAQLTEPLVALTSPKSPFKWTEIENNAFQKLQEIFFTKPFILQPDFNKVFFLNTDASGFAISAVLMQESNGTLLPISYFSKALRNAEKRYAPIQQELMAIVYGVRAFKYILYGRPFVILSDSKPLSHFRKTESPAKMITRWLLELSEYTYTFKHLPGKLNFLADFLSRTPVQDNSSDLNSNPNLISSSQILPIVPNESQECLNVNTVSSNDKPPVDPLLEISIESIKYHQQKDKDIQKIKQGIIDNDEKFKRFLICPASHLIVYIDEISNQNSTSNKIRILLPPSLQTKCMQIFHLCHFGIEKTCKLISEKYYWKGLFNSVTQFVNSCTKCIQFKNQRIPKAPFQNSHIPTRPGEFISLDFVGPFRNNSYILTVIDHFSKHIQLYPLKNITAMHTVDAIFDYISIHGRPEMILTDNGTQFKSQIFQEFNHMLGINLKFTTVRNPQANAVSERINTAIKSTVYALMDDGYTFQNAIRTHQIMYNSTFHSTIKTSPNKVHFGRALSNIMDTFNTTDFNDKLDVHSDYYMICDNLHKLYKEIHDNLLNFQKLQNNKQKNPKSRVFNIGDTVYMFNDDKFKRKSSGPFEVIEKVNEVIVKIRFLHDHNAPLIQVHTNKLKVVPNRHDNRWSSPATTVDTQLPVPVTTTVSQDIPTTNSSIELSDQQQSTNASNSAADPQTSGNSSDNVTSPIPQHPYNLRSKNK